MKTVAVYTAAVIVGVGTAFFVLAIARGAPIGANPAQAGAAVVAGLGIVAALLAGALPRHWIELGLIVSVPLALLGIVMFTALADTGGYFWIWLWVGLGGLAAALAGAFLARRLRRA